MVRCGLFKNGQERIAPYAHHSQLLLFGCGLNAFKVQYQVYGLQQPRARFVGDVYFMGILRRGANMQNGNRTVQSRCGYNRIKRHGAVRQNACVDIHFENLR